MSELLFEIYSEEIPARMQKQAAENLKDLFTKKLQGFLESAEIKTFVGPNRLVLVAPNLPLKTPEIEKEIKGPRVNAPIEAINGFLKSNNNISQSDLTVIENPKGDFYVYRFKEKPQDFALILQPVLKQILQEFPWPKSMKWGTTLETWVRPIRNILAIFDGNIIDLEFAGFKANNNTIGHRFMDPSKNPIQNFEEYNSFLKKNFVILDFNERCTIIKTEVQKLANELGLQIILDQSLIEENAGLVEYPFIASGKFDEKFLKVPSEILVTSMKVNQKYFALEKNGVLSNQFIFVANIPLGKDSAVIKGNERVLVARLSDALFFFEQDLKEGFEEWKSKLERVTFHFKLGSMSLKTKRMAEIAKVLSAKCGENSELAAKASLYAKADLQSLAVGEFPELQGVMSKYYLPKDIGFAVSEHYAPLGQNDKIPSTKLGIVISFADKLDSLVGLFSAGEKVTGSRDPFGLRRFALGLIRLILDGNIDISMKEMLSISYDLIEKDGTNLKNKTDTLKEISEFLQDRLKFLLKSENIRHDYIAAVFAADKDINIINIYKKVTQLEKFLKTESGIKILTLLRRVFNILSIEEKSGNSYTGGVMTDSFQLTQEGFLYEKLNNLKEQVSKLLANKEYSEAIFSLQDIEFAVSDFFDKVKVNDDDSFVRENRLNLLNKIRALVGDIADFSLIENT